MAIGYANCLTTAQSDGSALANTTTAGSILPTAARIIIPGGYLSWIGQMLSIEAAGRISVVGGGGVGNITFSVRMGPSSPTILVGVSSAMNLNATAKTNVTWTLRWDLTVRSIGSGTAATFIPLGEWSSEAIVGSPLPTVGGSGELSMPLNTPGVGDGFDSTVDNFIDLFAQWSTASASNSIQLHQYRLVSWN